MEILPISFLSWHWPLVLALCFSVLGIGLLVKKKYGNSWQIMRSESRRAKSERALSELRLIGPKMIVVLALGMIAISHTGTFLVGYFYRDHQLASRQVTYTVVLVKEKFDDQHFSMQPARMKPIGSTLCAESLVDWKQGETLEDWTFEQKRGCKRVIMYHRYPKGELNARN